MFDNVWRNFKKHRLAPKDLEGQKEVNKTLVKHIDWLQTEFMTLAARVRKLEKIKGIQSSELKPEEPAEKKTESNGEYEQVEEKGDV